MAALARCTPSFAPPATQNTAPVHEFRCLYTHDVRKKAKKWHDGSARFHTFNKRVMVYDDSKSYIGDLHYRADEEFGEGVELQLDRGVLVEVGERVGQTHTDLTGIIHRSHADASSPSAASTTAQSRPTQRINAVHTQGRPKSLSELLGPSQGRTSRARLPLQSPFEQRHGTSRAQYDEPRSKRQKISLDKENETPAKDPEELAESIASVARIQQATITQSVHRQRDAVSDLRPSEPDINVGANVIDISSDEEAIARPKKAKLLSKKKSRSDTASGGKGTVLGQKLNKNILLCSTDNVTDSGNKLNPSYENRDIASSVSDAPKPRTSQLRMTSQRPRQKLMYRALLPTTMREENPYPTLRASIEPQPRIFSMRSATPSTTLESTNAALEIRSIPMSDGFDDLVSAHESLCPPQEAPETPRQPSPIRVDSTSPLFVPQSQSQESPPGPQPIRHDVLNIPATQDLFARATRSPENDVEDVMDLVDDDAVIGEPDSPFFPQPPQRPKVTVQMSPQLRPETKDYADEAIVSEDPLLYSNVVAHPPLDPFLAASQPLARSLSENERLEGCSQQSLPQRAPANLSKSSDAPRASSAQLCLPLPGNHTDENQATRSPVQHSRSDTTNIIPHAIASSPPPLVSDEQGPWTKAEAFLLFDTWPHCKAKDKPVFERIQVSEPDSSGDEEVSRINSMPANRAFHPVIIRSARHVLRDDY